MNSAFHNSLAAHGASLITHIALFDSGVEISGGGYARKPVTWSGAGNVKSLSDDLVFDIPSGATVSEWRGFSALTGGTDYGGKGLTPAAFSNPGTYTLLAASTSITIQEAA